MEQHTTIRKESEGYRTIKNAAVRFVESMKVGEKPGVYKKDPLEEHPSLYGSYHAAHILDLFGELVKYSQEQLDSWAELFQERQCEQGFFSNRPEDRTRVRRLEELDPVWHFTRGMIWSLRVLGKKAWKEFYFLEPFLKKETLYAYVKRYDWSNSWAAGNQVLALATALMALRDWFRVPYVDELLEYGMFPALEELLDEKTGFWGCQYGASLQNGMFGTIHVLPVYYAQGWEYRPVERSVDSTLSIQLQDGSFWPCGSDCPDFDGAYMLYNLYQVTDYRKEDLEHAAQRYLQHALMHLSPDGVGFLIHRRDSKPGEWVSRPHFCWVDGKNIPIEEFRDEDPQRSKIMLGSWFYPLSIALVSRIPPVTGFDGPYKLTRMSLHECTVTEW